MCSLKVFKSGPDSSTDQQKGAVLCEPSQQDAAEDGEEEGCHTF